jgi:hypothetical protein
MMRSFVLLIGIVVTFCACEETILLDLKQTESKVVIEAQVTNHPGYQFVKVTRSANFYAKGKTPRITTATVTVTDDVGAEFQFVHNPGGSSDSLGIYLPAIPFVGEVDRTYTLKVTVDATVYEATDKLVSVIPIEKLEYQVNDEEKQDPKDKGKFYELLIFTTEPQDEKNYYLFKFYRNDSLVYYNDTDIYFSDDEFLAENIEGVPSPVFYGVGDRGRVEAYSLSRKGYIFYGDLWNILNNDAGGMFGPIPASPRTNISNGALGFFQVSAVSMETIEIQQ